MCMGMIKRGFDQCSCRLEVGGPGGVRTLDLMTASHARSQLRHRPIFCVITLIRYYSIVPSQVKRAFEPPKLPL